MSTCCMQENVYFQVSLGLEKLAAEIERLSDPYPLALITYALSLAGNQRLNSAMSRLDSLKTESGEKLVNL